MKIEEITNLIEAHEQLLALADPSQTLVNDYCDRGLIYEATLDDRLVGILVLLPVNRSDIEIKNVAVAPEKQGQGMGQKLLTFAKERAHSLGYKQLFIGTGNSSLGQLALYQKMGFEVDSIKKNFFVDNYAKPIFENGIECKHMVMLKMLLGY